MNAFQYIRAFAIPSITIFSLTFKGYFSYSTILIAFGLIPFLELFMKPNPANVNLEEEKERLSDKNFDRILYGVSSIHLVTLGYFFWIIGSEMNLYERIGMTLSMGVQCGAIGINVAHELGHRKNNFEQTLARIMLATSLYMHFIVEHNKGHHKYVATPKDPATARLNETIYHFWVRSIVYSFLSAWEIAKNDASKKGFKTLSLRNEMVAALLFELILLIAIYVFFGAITVVSFLAAALIGILLLETVNYIEHYGLMRKETSPGKFERVQPCHSWNSDSPIGRVVLFELTRHSDHHYLASRKYQILRHIDDSPQLPTGYPGAMLMSLVPAIWFKVINPRIPQE